MTPHYRHTQVGWVMVGGLLAAALVTLVLLPGARAPLPASVAMVLVLLALALFCTLTVEVDRQQLRLGFTAGLIRRRIRVADVAAFRPVRNAWWYGFGIRVVPGGGWLWNVSGLDAIELLLADGSRFRIGTDEPAALSRALEQATGLRPGEPARDTAVRRSRRGGPWLAIVAAVVVAVAAGLIVMLFRFQMAPPKVTVSPDRIVIDTPFYGDRYALDDVTDVALQRCLPRILARTNGFAASGVLRGWFRVEGLGEGKLFVDAGNPPFVLLRLRNGFAIVNLADAQQTQALYEEIQQQRGARATQAN